MRELLRRACRAGPERGQTMAEYAIVLGVITVVVLASLTALQGAIQSGVDAVSGLIDSVT